MYNLDLFVIAIYCFIEDELYPAFCKVHGKPRRAGFEPGLSDAECLTMDLTHFGCCCRIGQEESAIGKTAVCGLNTSSVWTEFGIRQQHRFGGYLISM